MIKKGEIVHISEQYKSVRDHHHDKEIPEEIEELPALEDRRDSSSASDSEEEIYSDISSSETIINSDIENLDANDSDNETDTCRNDNYTAQIDEETPQNVNTSNIDTQPLIVPLDEVNVEPKTGSEQEHQIVNEDVDKGTADLDKEQEQNMDECDVEDAPIAPSDSSKEGDQDGQNITANAPAKQLKKRTVTTRNQSQGKNKKTNQNTPK